MLRQTRRSVSEVMRGGERMQDLVFALRRLAERNRDGSFKTQYDRKHMLMLMGEQLVALGYKQLQPGEIKGRHVQKLLQRWQEEGISAGTQSNRLAVLRWWCEKVGRSSVMAKSNAVYGIGQRERVSEESKGKRLEEGMLAQVGDAHVRMSLRMIEAFGLRRKESLLVRVHEADKGEYLALQASWTKGGLARQIPITMLPEQRDVVEAVKAFVPYRTSSLIPENMTYIRQRHKFDFWVQKIGLGGAHGLRHSWAQRRYLQLTQFLCPHAGGPLWEDMTDEQRARDTEARSILSREMGHFRAEITQTYIGKKRRSEESASELSSG